MRLKTAFVSETAYLQCGNGETVTTQVDWSYQSSPDAMEDTIISLNHLTNGNFEGRLNISGTTLIINNVNKNDTGVYTCVEDTPYRTKHYVNFTVKGKVNEYIFYVMYSVL